MMVGLLTELQKDSLIEQQFDNNQFFNPVQDGNNNWIISTQEIDNCVNPNFDWVKSLSLIEFVPKTSDIEL